MADTRSAHAAEGRMRSHPSQATATVVGKIESTVLSVRSATRVYSPGFDEWGGSDDAATADDDDDDGDSDDVDLSAR